MPLSSHRDERGFIRVDLQGALAVTRRGLGLRESLGDIDEVRRILIDIRDATGPLPKYPDIRETVGALDQSSAAARERKRAFVVSTDVQFGVARTFQAIVPGRWRYFATSSGSRVAASLRAVPADRPPELFESRHEDGPAPSESTRDRTRRGHVRGRHHRARRRADTAVGRRRRGRRAVCRGRSARSVEARRLRRRDRRADRPQTRPNTAVPPGAVHVARSVRQARRLRHRPERHRRHSGTPRSRSPPAFRTTSFER